LCEDNPLTLVSCIVEDQIAYQQCTHNLQEVIATSLTEVGARYWFALEYNRYWSIGGYEEEPDWFCYELVGIVAVRLKTL
jgi:hypothetical protein